MQFIMVGASLQELNHITIDHYRPSYKREGGGKEEIGGKDRLVDNYKMGGKLLLGAWITTFLLVCALADSHGCDPKQYYSSSSGRCEDCVSGCLSCLSSECLLCSVGSYLSAGVCVQCSTDNCAVCPNNKCNFCNSGYQLADDRSCQSLNYSLVIAYIIGAVCLIVVLSVSCCCYCLNRCREALVVSNARHAPPQLHSVARMEGPSLQEIALDEEWKADQELGQRKEESCPFCLQPQVDLQLPCRHLYHIGCIAQWLSRHSECPLCKRYVGGQAKLYCSQCFSFGIRFDAFLITNSKVNQKRICENCTQNSQQILLPESQS